MSTEVVVPQVEELRVRGQGIASRGGGFSDTASHELAARLFVKGMKVAEIAEHLGRAPHTIKRWFWRADIRAKVQELSKEAFARLDEEIKQQAETTFQRITQASDDALDKLLDLMTHADSEVVQMRCAQDVLDRNPETSKTQKVQSTKRVVVVDAALINAVLNAEKEAGITIDG